MAKIKVISKAKVSNKDKSLPETDPVKPVQAPHSPVPSKGPIPFIDKISIVLSPQSEAHACSIHSALWPLMEDKEVFKDTAKGKWGKYKRVKMIALEALVNTKKFPLLQYAFADHKADQLRLEFAPVDLGPVGMTQLSAVFASIVPDGWEYVVKRGRITRIDIAVDIPGVRMDAFQFLPKQGATQRAWTVQGNLETLVHGKATGNQTVIYSRKKKRLAKGQKWSGPSQVRIERRLRNPSCSKLFELAKMPNPFGEIIMTLNMPGPPDGEKDKGWSLFVDSVRQRGLGPALQLLSKEKRTMYRKYLKAHPQPWWNPEVIWQQWPAALQSSLLTSYLGSSTSKTV